MTDHDSGAVPPIPPPAGPPAPAAPAAYAPQIPIPAAYTSPPRQSTSGLAIAALIVGIGAFLIGWIPFVGAIVGIVGIVLGAIAVRKPLGRGLAIGGLILSTIATITSIVMVLLVLVWLPGIDRDNAGGFGDEPVVPAPESAPASQAIDTPCYSFDGPEGYINDISTDTAEGCATELELWGELREDGTVNNTGVGAIHATVTVEPVRSATADGWGTDGTLDGLLEFLEQDYIPGMGTPLADPEPVSLGGVDAYLTRVDSTVDETKTKALLVTLAPTDYSTPNGDVGVFVVSFVTVEDNGDAIIKTLIDSWDWK